MVKKTESCWLWLGSRTTKGYPRFKENGKTTAAHRYALEIAEGHLLKPGEQACHGCDIRHCVRVGLGHIFRGTQADNIADAISKGRMATGNHNAPRKRFLDRHVTGEPITPKNTKARGVKHGMSKLKADEIISIRRLATELTHSEIAERFGISQGAVSMILSRKRWAHI